MLIVVGVFVCMLCVVFTLVLLFKGFVVYHWLLCVIRAHSLSLSLCVSLPTGVRVFRRTRAHGRLRAHGLSINTAPLVKCAGLLFRCMLQPSIILHYAPRLLDTACIMTIKTRREELHKLMSF